MFNAEMMKALQEDQDKLDSLQEFSEETNWYNEAKYYEQQLMCSMDSYAEVAVALGFEPVSLWGDVNVPHHIIVERAKELKKYWDGNIDVPGN